MYFYFIESYLEIERACRMNNNQISQDKKEQRCLDLVKKSINMNDCFGMSDQQYVELQKWLKDTKPNQKSNEFPDFLFENGFIEHFSVTSSADGRKGAKQTKESALFRKKSEKSFLNNLDKSEEKTLTSSSFSRPSEKHTHLNIVESIKKHWLSHIKSYAKTTPSKHSIFLLEYVDVNIETAIIKEDILAKVYDSYRISVDKDLLEWIYTFKEKIKYLILYNPFSIEVIRIDQIPNIIDNIPKVMFEPVIVARESHRFIGAKFKIEDI